MFINIEIPGKKHFKFVEGLVLASKPDENPEIQISIEFNNIRTLAIKYNCNNKQARVLL